MKWTYSSEGGFYRLCDSIAVDDQCISYSVLLGVVGGHYLMNYWPEDYSDVTIAFLDPENVGIDILHAILL